MKWLATEEIARVACFPPHHFHRIFRGMAGESVQEHVRRLRLERAAQELKSLEFTGQGSGFEGGLRIARGFHHRFPCHVQHVTLSISRRGRAPAQFPLGSPLQQQARLQSAGLRRYAGRNNDDRAATHRVYPSHGALQSTAGHVEDARGVGASARLFGASAWFLGVAHDDPDIMAPLSGVLRRRHHGQPGHSSRTTHRITELAGGDYVTMMHKGPYELLGRSFRRNCWGTGCLQAGGSFAMRRRSTGISTRRATLVRTNWSR